MELAFRTVQLRAICEDADRAARRYSESTCRHLRARLSDLRAASSVAEVIAGRPRIGVPDEASMTIDLGDAARLVLCSNHPVQPRTSEGDLDWTKVRRLQVVDISEES